jgi:hypothetical protein
VAIIVVGGSSRNVGKTSVVAGLIAAMPHLRWTAFKVTPHWHGEPSAGEDPIDVREQRDANAGTDTARFLAAGAVRSLLVKPPTGDLAEAMPRIREELNRSENAIFESNSILQFLQPDLYLTVLGGDLDDFKQSSRLYLERADAILAPENWLNSAAWKEISLKLAHATPVLPIWPPVYVTEDVQKFVKARIGR